MIFFGVRIFYFNEKKWRIFIFRISRFSKTIWLQSNILPWRLGGIMFVNFGSTCVYFLKIWNCSRLSTIEFLFIVFRRCTSYYQMSPIMFFRLSSLSFDITNILARLAYFNRHFLCLVCEISGYYTTSSITVWTSVRNKVEKTVFAAALCRISFFWTRGIATLFKLFVRNGESSTSACVCVSGWIVIIKIIA